MYWMSVFGLSLTNLSLEIGACVLLRSTAVRLYVLLAAKGGSKPTDDCPVTSAFELQTCCEVPSILVCARLSPVVSGTAMSALSRAVRSSRAAFAAEGSGSSLVRPLARWVSGSSAAPGILEMRTYQLSAEGASTYMRLCLESARTRLEQNPGFLG